MPRLFHTKTTWFRFLAPAMQSTSAVHSRSTSISCLSLATHGTFPGFPRNPPTRVAHPGEANNSNIVKMPPRRGPTQGEPSDGAAATMPSAMVVGAAAGNTGPPPQMPPLSLVRSLSAKLSMMRQIVEQVCWSPKADRRLLESPAMEPPPRRCPYSAVLKNPEVPYEFTMPLHYPRYTREQYESMPEWQIDRLLEEYGLPAAAMGSLEAKRDYAIGAFLWS